MHILQQKVKPMTQTFTADQIALRAHIQAQNDQWVAECEASGATFYTTTVTDPAHWAQYGVTTVTQYERFQLESSIWDLYKDVHGYRPRHLDLNQCTDAELERLYQDLIQLLQEAQAAEAAEQAQADQAFEALVAQTIQMGAGDRPTALRWIQQADASV
jgi:hypothetical protein